MKHVLASLVAAGLMGGVVVGNPKCDCDASCASNFKYCEKCGTCKTNNEFIEKLENKKSKQSN